MKSGVYEAPEGGATFEFVNDSEHAHQPEYVEFTAPEVCCLRAKVDETPVVTAWAGSGGAHSWWTAAGGRFLRYPLQPGQKLVVSLSGKGAVRIDWYA